jgi:hypothetical protein
MKFKKRMPRWANNLCIVLAAVLCCAVLGGLSSGFTNWDTESWFDKEANPDNLIKVENYLIQTEEGTQGIDIDVDEKGVIKLSGKATEDFEEAVVTLNLTPGTYTLGGMNSQKGKSGLKIEYNGITHYAGIDSETEGETFTISEDEGTVTATVYVFVDDDKSAPLLPIKPTLAKGDEEISFWK